MERQQPSGNDNVKPKILLGGATGTDITEKTTTVVVGQQIVLYASYGNVTATSQSWSIPGTIVGGFTATLTAGGSTAATLNAQSTTFYWVTAGTSQTVTFTLTYGSNQTATAQTTFNVLGPSLASFQAATPGKVNTDQTYIYLGGPVANSVSFTATVNPPSGYTGNQVWAQTIGSVAVSWTGSSNYSCSGSGLDTSWPWPATVYSSPPKTTNANDNPSAALLQSKGYNDVTFNQQSDSMYLFWQPTISGANTIPVPIGYISWSWYEEATYSAGQWQIVGPGTTSKGSVGTFTAVSSYPTWNTDFVPATQCHP